MFCIFYSSLTPETQRLERFIKPLASQMTTEQELEQVCHLVSSNSGFTFWGART